MIKIIGYYADKDKPLGPNTVFVAINEHWDRAGKYITAYCPIGQHGPLDKKYLKECIKISKEQYLQASKGFYTPEEYLRSI